MITKLKRLGASVQAIAQMFELRDETRQMPFADREREFGWWVICLIEERTGRDGTLGETVLTSPNLLSTLPQRFACARLPQPCLPGSSSRLFRNVHHHGF